MRGDPKMYTRKNGMDGHNVTMQCDVDVMQIMLQEMKKKEIGQ